MLQVSRARKRTFDQGNVSSRRRILRFYHQNGAFLLILLVQARYILATLLSKRSQVGGQGLGKMLHWVSFARCAHKSPCIHRVAR